jgi:hypothetical protein
MERNKKYLIKGASVLLIAATLILSSIAVTADTTDETDQASTSLIDNVDLELNDNNAVSKQGSKGALLWDNGLPDGRNGCSCVLWPSYPLDREIIDDFTVPDGGWSVCDGHFRIVTYGGAGPEIIDAVRVFFYKSTGPCEPDMERFVERDATFSAYTTGDMYFDRPEIAVDCEFECVDLTPGEWWVCFQPEMDDNSFWLTTVESECSIFVSYPDLGAPKWTWGFDQFADFYDVSFQLTGHGGPGFAAICCDGVRLNFGEAGPGATVTGEIVVVNCGDPGTYLSWAVDTVNVPPWGTWTFTPAGGTGLAEGDDVTVQVECELTDVKGVYNGDLIVVNADDPSDFCKVPTSVEVPRARSYNPMIWNLFQQFPALYQIMKIIFGA